MIILNMGNTILLCILVQIAEQQDQNVVGCLKKK